MPTRAKTDAVLRFELRVPDALRAEIAAAEAWAAGACGIEERDGAEGAELIVYAPAPVAVQVREVSLASAGTGARAEPLEAVEEKAWSEAWKEGLEAIDVSARLRVRPSFVDTPPAPGQRELVIDPGQAFGTGAHASTRLALEWVDAIMAAPRGRAGPGARVLDVGTGSGVLALAALALGAREAVAFDLDPLAAPAALEAAHANGLAERLRIFTGPFEALVPGAHFELVVANLLLVEALAVAPQLAAATSPGGALVLSGLLRRDVAAAESAFAPLGLGLTEQRSQWDADREEWVGLLLTRST